MASSDDQFVWPNTWTDMWADRSVVLHNAPTAPNELVEGDVVQDKVYVTLLGKFFHFDPHCPCLTNGVNEEWYAVISSARSAPSILGGIDTVEGHALKPCSLCAAMFLRQSQNGC